MDNGAQVAWVALCLREFVNDREFKTFVPVEVWGRASQTIAELPVGATILVRGKLRWMKRGEKQGLEVMSWSVQTASVAPGVAAGSN